MSKIDCKDPLTTEGELKSAVGDIEQAMDEDTIRGIKNAVERAKK